MEKGHSKLLMFEWIIPKRDVPWFPAFLDINLMALLSGMERTEAQWQTLLDSAGFEIVKFWKTSPDTEGMIEAVLKGENEKEMEDLVEPMLKRENETEMEAKVEAMVTDKTDTEDVIEAPPKTKETVPEAEIEILSKWEICQCM